MYLVTNTEHLFLVHVVVVEMFGHILHSELTHEGAMGWSVSTVFSSSSGIVGYDYGGTEITKIFCFVRNY